MTDQPLGPLDANGLLRNPYGTRVTEAQQDARRSREAQRIEAAVAERERSLAAAAAEREQLRRADGAAQLEAYRLQCETRWADNGGQPGDFARAWPALRDEWLKARLGDRVAEDVARLRQRPEYQV